MSSAPLTTPCLLGSARSSPTIRSSPCVWPRAARRCASWSTADCALPVLRVVDRQRMATEEDLLQRSTRARPRSDVGVRPGEGARADIRVRAPHGRPHQLLRACRPRGRWSLGMVAPPRGRTCGLRRCPGAGAPRVHSDPREETLFFFGPRSERLASAYWSTSAATLRAATGIFTAQPTPNTRSLKI